MPLGDTCNGDVRAVFLILLRSGGAGTLPASVAMSDSFPLRPTWVHGVGKAMLASVDDGGHRPAPSHHAEMYSKQMSSRSSRHNRLMVPSVALCLPNWSASLATSAIKVLSSPDAYQMCWAALSSVCNARSIGWPRKLMHVFACFRSTVRRRSA